MKRTSDRPRKKPIFLIIGGFFLFAILGFIFGVSQGRAKQGKIDSEGQLAINLHCLNELKANNLEKLERDLKFLIYAGVETRNRLGGANVNSMSPSQRSRWEIASAIHSEMNTQIVSVTPRQLIDEVDSQAATNVPKELAE
ncbi:MAG TPA: hypothetical protein VFW05_05460 [Verrucomicrobiae bacterium]|nr:hypothetical protein [Verrucomicrobiae bacterium]